LEKRLEDLIARSDKSRKRTARCASARKPDLGARELLQKNEQVRARVEAMIGRLKSMEQA
jgi:uncharacterized protein (TIGR02449 family)